MKKRYWILLAIGGLSSAIYLGNASWTAKPPENDPTLLAHRGVHQTYHREGLTNETCTAERIDPPAHAFIENTLPSIQAAVDHGADIIEIDIHPTTDGDFVVFHDWTLDCRTDGSGRTRDHSLAELKALDIGYGYTADGGKMFPFRGQFVGAMPTLNEVLVAFPETGFMINIKSGSAQEGEALVSYIDPQHWPRLGFVGNHKPLGVIQETHPMNIYMTRRRAKDCLKGYVATGWFGRVPAACHETYVPVPLNYRILMWGWPHKFEQRLAKAGSRSMLIGPIKDGITSNIDEPEQIRLIPENYSGIIVTDKIEVVGSAITQRGRSGE